MSKKARLSEFNRNNIISAAKQLFAEKGMPQTTMDEIAKKSDCSKSTIYVYFKSKEEIFDCIVLEHFILLKNVVEEAINKTTIFPESFFAICNGVAGFYNSNPFYLESILGEIKIDESESNPVLFQMYTVGEQLNDIIVDYLKACIANGNIRDESHRLYENTFALWGALCGIISLAHKKEKYIEYRMSVSKEEFMQNGFDFLLRSLMP